MTALAPLLTAMLLAAPHDGPAKRIVALTKRMATVGRTAELLYQRSLCHLEMRSRRMALLDLDDAITLQPHHRSALLERVRVLAALGQSQRALAAAEQAGAHLKSGAMAAKLSFIEAMILTRLGRHGDALRRTRATGTATQDDIATALLRSTLQARLGLHAERERELRLRVERMRAARCVLPAVENEWIDALIATGNLDRAHTIVAQRLRESRFQSRWLLRRARIHRSSGAQKRAQADALAALRELTQRIRPRNPDLLLVADRAEALWLLGRMAEAKQDRALLRRRAFPELLLLKLGTALKE